MEVFPSEQAISSAEQTLVKFYVNLDECVNTSGWPKNRNGFTVGLLDRSYGAYMRKLRDDAVECSREIAKNKQKYSKFALAKKKHGYVDLIPKIKGRVSRPTSVLRCKDGGLTSNLEDIHAAIADIWDTIIICQRPNHPDFTLGLSLLPLAKKQSGCGDRLRHNSGDGVKANRISCNCRHHLSTLRSCAICQ